MKKWFAIKQTAVPSASGMPSASSSAGSQATPTYAIDIHDYIDPYWGVSAKDFLAELAQIPADAMIKLSINSYGGDVFEGLAIYNALKARQAYVHAEVVGVACSIASVILMAAGRIVMPENAYVMVHGCSGMVWGNQDDVQNYADVMGSINSTMQRIYMERTGADEATVQAWLSKDNYFNGAEALAAGLCDETVVSLKLAACTNMQALQRNAHAPDGFKALFAAVQAATEPQNPAAVEIVINENSDKPDDFAAQLQERMAAMQACLSAKESLLAEHIGAGTLSTEHIEARLERAAAIRALADIAHYPADKTDELVLNDSPIASARAVIAQFTASRAPSVTSMHSAEDHHRLPKSADSGKQIAVLDVAGIYAQRKQ